jgi:hypothetical protein
VFEGERAKVGLKFDQEKPRMALVPPQPIMEIAEVLTYGAKKYAAHNWCHGISFERLKSAMDRHMAAWWAGEDCDPETGYSHLAHAACCLFFLMDLRHTRPDMDDRPKGLLARVRPTLNVTPQELEDAKREAWYNSKMRPIDDDISDVKIGDTQIEMYKEDEEGK